MKPLRILLAGSAIALAGAAVALAASWWSAPAAPSVAALVAAPATAEVTRGPLRDTKTVTGTLSYGDLTALRPGTDVAGMVTWIATVGATVSRGEPLYRLDGQPTLLFYGATPQHRMLRFEPGTADPVWVELEEARTAAEAAALTLQLEQERLADGEARLADLNARLADAQSPTPLLAEFVQLTGAVQAAEAKLARVGKLSAAELTPAVQIAGAEAELAAARASFDGAIRGLQKDVAATRIEIATSRIAVAGANVKRDSADRALATLEALASDDEDVRQIADNLAALGYEGKLPEQVAAWQRDAGLPATGIIGPGQIVVAAGPVHIAAHDAGIGETLSAASADGGTIASYSSVDKLVTVPLPIADLGLAAVGRAVSITLPDDSTVEGTISEVGSIVTDGAVEVTIDIADQGALAELEIASVDVEFVSDSRDDVLSVPVAALLALPERGFAVEVIAGAASTLVPVETGLFAASRVEVSGEGIAEGMLVGVPG